MISRIRKAQQDEGFTLIELLVVMIIIGILAAIAIPVFLNQRAKGWDSAVKSDLKNAATAQETFLTETGRYSPAVTEVALQGFKFSPVANYTGTPAAISVLTYTTGATANSFAAGGTTVATAGNAAYCMVATSASAQIWVYDSRNGGLQPNTITTCVA